MDQAQSTLTQPVSAFNMPPAPVTEKPVTQMVSTPGHTNSADYKSLLITGGLIALAGFITYVSANLNILKLTPVEYLVVSGVLTVIGKYIQKLTDGPKASQ